MRNKNLGYFSDEDIVSWKSESQKEWDCILCNPFVVCCILREGASECMNLNVERKPNHYYFISLRKYNFCIQF